MAINNKQIALNRASAKKFKERYSQAIKNKEETFTFQEQEVLTSFAKYLIMHLEENVFHTKL